MSEYRGTMLSIPSQIETDDGILTLKVFAKFIRMVIVCRCGNPESLYKYMRIQLRSCEHDRVRERFAGGDGPYMLIANIFDKYRLTEHGGSIYGAWRTPLGDAMLKGFYTWTVDDCFEVECE